MKISFSPYELEASHGFREGALIKIDFLNGSVGYADCHPWPELGDLHLSQQLEKLAHHEWTPITQCALEWAKIDAKCRLEKKALINIPRSHFLISNILEYDHLPKGFTHFKIKMGRNLEKELEALLALFFESPLKIRLDFNEALTEKHFQDVLKGLKPLKNQIDFIEDPFPYDPEKWKKIQQQGWVLACDRQASLAAQQPQSAQVLIIKPAIIPFNEWKKWQNCIVTSYLGHPIGQIAAAFAAAQVDPHNHYLHGLNSHIAYKPTPFSRQLNWEGPEFTCPSKTNFWFDEDLQRISWKPL